MTLLLNKPNGLQDDITTSHSTVEGATCCSARPQQGRLQPRPVLRLRELAAGVKSNAAKNDPQIAVVEIGAWDVSDDTVDGTTLKVGSSAWNSYFSEQLAKAISILIHSGAQVALMGVPCYRPIAAGGLPLLPERGDDSRTRHLNVLLQQAADEDPQRVFMIHPPGAFCDNPSIATNTAYRWDGTHYCKPGAAREYS